MVRIEYVGLKPAAFDNVAGSRQSWNGNGDVQEVTEAQAKILLKYPDQWALAEGEKDEFIDQPDPPVVVEGSDGELEVVAKEELGTDLENMTVAQLRAFAMDKYGEKVKGTGRKEILDQVEELVRTR